MAPWSLANSPHDKNQLRKSPMAGIITLNTYGANRRWMIPGKPGTFSLHEPEHPWQADTGKNS